MKTFALALALVALTCACEQRNQDALTPRDRAGDAETSSTSQNSAVGQVGVPGNVDPKSATSKEGPDASDDLANTSGSDTTTTSGATTGSQMPAPSPTPTK